MATVVPRCWPGETFLILGCGPSLTQADVDFCRGRARVIAINQAVTLAPWADVLYACDAQFWKWHKGIPSFTGLKYTLEAEAGRWPGVQVLERTGGVDGVGVELKPTGIRSGKNSGFQAINVAVHLGAAKIVLLGYDMRGTHFFGNYPWPSNPNWNKYVAVFSTLIKPLRALGIEIINCTPGSMLRCFPMQSLRQALGNRQDVAS